MESAVLFLLFNRPESTAKVFAEVRRARPQRLFLAGDGPRADMPGEAEQCAKARAIASEVDWDCDVQTRFLERNEGCCGAVSGAIDWFFSHVEEGIIIEDDTLPSTSFFSFCSQMLARYRDVPSVMHISGDNFQFGRVRGNGEYYASRFAHSWGWATWRRAWEKYDLSLDGFPEEWPKIAKACELPPDVANWWKINLENAKQGRCNTWDFQWHYAVMKHLGVCLIPNRNLVQNIGIGADATHMQDQHIAAGLPTRPLRRFNPPSRLQIDQEADYFDFSHALHNEPSPPRSLREFIASFLFNLRHAW
jgi:hypothetical protein